LGISSGASLGAALAIAFGFRFPRLPFSGSVILAALFAFASLILILSLSYMLDSSFSTNTIILLGIVFSMFMSSVLSLVVTFAPDKLKQITFWTMGSLAGSSYQDALVLFAVLAVCGAILIRLAEELNAFAIGEENAMNVGVDVRRVRLVVLVTVSLLIGACVSIGGTIGFVGLVTPHIIRLLTGPNHKRLLPASMFGGATFLTLADLVARAIAAPLELPIGVVTSFVGAILFVYIYYKVGRTAR
jgi:iron complex transport system permease protein